MLALQHDLTIEQQTSFLKVFQWLNSNNTPIDLTGYETELEIRNGNGRRVDVFDTTNGLCVNGADGKMTFTVPAGRVEEYLLDEGARYSLKVFNQTGSEIAETGGWTSTSFDVDDGTGRGSMTANGGTPFSGLVVGDYVSVTITTSDSVEHSGIYKIETQSNTVLTFASVLGGEDSNQSTNVSIFELDPDRFYRLSEGKFTFSEEQALIGYKHAQ